MVFAELFSLVFILNNSKCSIEEMLFIRWEMSARKLWEIHNRYGKMPDRQCSRKDKAILNRKLFTKIYAKSISLTRLLHWIMIRLIFNRLREVCKNIMNQILDKQNNKTGNMERNEEEVVRLYIETMSNSVMRQLLRIMLQCEITKNKACKIMMMKLYSYM